MFHSLLDGGFDSGPRFVDVEAHSQAGVGRSGGVQPVNAGDLIRPCSLASRDIEFPTANVGHLARQAQQVVLMCEELLRPLAFGDIADHNA